VALVLLSIPLVLLASADVELALAALPEGVDHHVAQGKVVVLEGAVLVAVFTRYTQAVLVVPADVQSATACANRVLAFTCPSFVLPRPVGQRRRLEAAAVFPAWEKGCQRAHAS
jgi:hypothetical protein